VTLADPSIASAAEHAQRVATCADPDQRLALAARWVLDEFDAYYVDSRRIPGLAKQAFERCDPATSLTLSRRRLSMYSVRIERLGPELKAAFPEVAEDELLWERMEALYLPHIESRYAADLAFAFFHSVRRRIYQGEWKPVAYSFGEGGPHGERGRGVHLSFPLHRRLDVATVERILAIPGFEVPYRDAREDAALIVERVNTSFTRPMRRVDMVDAGFFRRWGAYLVGRITFEDGAFAPLILSLFNDERGIYADAVITSEADAHNLFSSTLANFHVTHSHYHELASFLHTVMPRRPLGLHYSTIGFNHVGKVAVMNELEAEILGTGEVFETAVGFRGTVAIGFATPSSDYNLKVIRDRPTAQYKWGEFEGIGTVLEKYKRVHEINRAGSMLDNIIYYNLELDRSWFDPELLEELLRDASESVSLRGKAVVLKYLIVQRRMRPLPVFLESASREEAETAIVNLGYCIKNNAAANVFNKDLDARNYGVSRFLKVYLYDYDALEPFTEVKIRSNAGREEGEEEVPDWYFEEGVVFLPEEIEAGLMLDDRHLRRVFRAVHGDLLGVPYWQRVQDQLLAGEVPMAQFYPPECRLRG
jgi:isocitrate dehydrogenase kinase/phosphatase